MDKEKILVQAMEDLEESTLMEYVDELYNDGVDYHHIEQLLQTGIREVGRKFEKGEYFLADLIFSGVLYREVVEKICDMNPPVAEGDFLGTVLLGVMEGDIHDIGKDIVRQTLWAEGFRVIDLGVDVSAQRFLEAACEFKPDIITLSGVMGFAVEKMQKVIQLLEENGIRKNAPIIVGGNCMTQKVSIMLGADGYTENPLDYVALCKKIMENKKKHDE